MNNLCNAGVAAQAELSIKQSEIPTFSTPGVSGAIMAFIACFVFHPFNGSNIYLRRWYLASSFLLLMSQH